MKVIQIDFQKLRERAESERWSDSAIARETGLTSAGVNKVLNGKTDPRSTNLKKICDTIGLPIEEAFVEPQAA